MNEFCMQEMKKNLDKYCSEFYTNFIQVLDLGSYDVNGTFKPLMPNEWNYVGVDIGEGPNVDVVMSDEYTIPLESDSIDLLISGSCFEHVRNPFRLMLEATRILRSGGLAIVMVPFHIVVHRYPIDCWRFLPDGMEALFDESRLETIEAYRIKDNINHRQIHCWGIGRKR